LRSEPLRHHHQQGPDPLSGRGSHGLPGRSRGHCLSLRPDPVEAGGRSAGGDRRRPARPGSRHRYVVRSGAVRDLLRCLDRHARSGAHRVRAIRRRRLPIGGGAAVGPSANADANLRAIRGVWSVTCRLE
jgi:hypothetical protein